MATSCIGWLSGGGTYRAALPPAPPGQVRPALPHSTLPTCVYCDLTGDALWAGGQGAVLPPAGQPAPGDPWLL
jgi:hypothetical protein